MRACIWYHVREKQPEKSGYYLAFKGLSLGDNETELSYFWYDAAGSRWSEGYSIPIWAKVIYWTDAEPDEWYADDPLTEAEKDAWVQVIEAIERYNVIRALTR